MKLLITLVLLISLNAGAAPRTDAQLNTLMVEKIIERDKLDLVINEIYKIINIKSEVPLIGETALIEKRAKLQTAIDDLSK